MKPNLQRGTIKALGYKFFTGGFVGVYDRASNIAIEAEVERIRLNRTKRRYSRKGKRRFSPEV